MKHHFICLQIKISTSFFQNIELVLQSGKPIWKWKRKGDSTQVSAHHIILVQFTNHDSKYLTQNFIFTENRNILKWYSKCSVSITW